MKESSNGHGQMTSALAAAIEAELPKRIIVAINRPGGAAGEEVVRGLRFAIEGAEGTSIVKVRVLATDGYVWGADRLLDYFVRGGATFRIGLREEVAVWSEKWPAAQLFSPDLDIPMWGFERERPPAAQAA